MGTSKLLISCFFFITQFGFAQNKMIVDSTKQEDHPPIGVFVCSATKMNNNDSIHRNIVISNAYKALDSLLKDNYKIINLNNIISYNQVFNKGFISFDINHKEIGKYAMANNCKRFLIVYYSENDLDFGIIPFLGTAHTLYVISYMQRSSKTVNGFTMHSSCQVFGWVYDSNSNHMLRRNRPIERHFENYVSTDNVKKSEVDKYFDFLSQLTVEMYQGLK